MKKTLAFYLVIVSFLIPLFSISASADTQTIDTGEKPFASEPITLSKEIVPTIELDNPGLIKVTITWTTPNLTFVKKVGGTYHPNVSYYGLNSKISVPFQIDNQSSVGTETSFNGSIIVTPSQHWANDQQAPNINIRSQNPIQQITIPLDGSDNSYVLEYSNNMDFADTPLALTLTADQIKDIMKATVSFEIKMKPVP